ncbi:MAG: type II CAAX endopeptidase family protein [Nocardioides sp.]|uniref:CPBP family intramembrane glutamic endopeptidase n=1 Tax=Nocardioides sp. TaxID=35761 RepID=UPI0039E36828
MADSMSRPRIVVILGLILGTIALGVSLHIPPGNDWFYPATLMLAALWTLVALASGQLRLDRAAERPRRALWTLVGLAVGAGLGLVFVVGGLIVRLIPGLDDYVASVLDYADRGNLPLVTVVTLVSGIAEELFFRGALYGCLERHPVAISTAVYAVVTAATGNVMLVFAALVLGLVTAVERRVTGGVLASAATHAVWAMAMLYALPPLFS